MVLRPLSDLREYQPPAIDVMVERERCACLLLPGLGKTICALSAFCRLRAAGRCQTGLVVAPAMIVESEIWSREAKAWAHTAHLRVLEVKGTAAQREALLIQDSDIIVISFENLIWLTDRVPRDRFTALIMDELSKLKHPGTKRFKRMRSKWLLDIPVRFGLTGSPVGNHYMDLWGEMFMVAGERVGIGSTLEEFTSRYFNQTRIAAHVFKYEMREGSLDEIKRLIKPHSFSLNAKLAAGQLPEVIDNPISITVPKNLLEMEKTLRKELELELRSGKTITALNASSLRQKIAQFSSGAVYTAGPEVEPRPWEEIHRLKLDALSNLQDELQGEPLLVFVHFKHEAERLVKEFKAVKMDGSTAVVDRWNRREIPLLIMSATNPHGLNLQRGGHNTVWFTPQWSREVYDQGVGRQKRLGQPNKFVISHSLLCGKLDLRIWDAVLEKGLNEADVMASVEIQMHRSESCPTLGPGACF